MYNFEAIGWSGVETHTKSATPLFCTLKNWKGSLRFHSKFAGVPENAL